MTKPQYPGIAVRLSDGNDYVIPRLLYAARADLAQKHGETLARLEAGKRAPGEQNFVQDTAHAALVRNYPDLTPEQSSELIEGELQNGAVRMVVAGLCHGFVSHRFTRR
jgi:hypothetical protein